LAQSALSSPEQLINLAESGLRGRVESLDENTGSVSISPLFRRMSDPALAVVSVATLLHQVSTRAQDAFDRATRLSEAGKYENAAEKLKKAIRLDPTFAAAHGNLGIQYARLGRYADAEAEFRQSTRLDPGSPWGYYNLAVFLSQHKRFEEAEASVRCALDRSPYNVQARFLLEYLFSRLPDTRVEAVSN
jgi:Flp pilus assembly protein TadD